MLDYGSLAKRFWGLRWLMVTVVAAFALSVHFQDTAWGQGNRLQEQLLSKEIAKQAAQQQYLQWLAQQNAMAASQKVGKQTNTVSKKPLGALGKKTPAAQMARTGAKENEYVVIFRSGTKQPKTQAQRLARLYGGSVLHDYHGAFVGCALRLARGSRDALKADPAVAGVEMNHMMYPCVEVVPTGVRRLQVNLGSSTNNGRIRNILPGGNIGSIFPSIAIVDTGIDVTHPDLNVVFNIGFGQPGNGVDLVGHGTHCAGIAAAIHNDIGVVGVAPGAPLWNVQVLGPNGGTTADLLAALQFLASNANQVKVISMSLGPAVRFTSAAVNASVDYCTSRGQVVCVAAGNSSDDAGFYSPANAGSAICVAAMADSDGLPGRIGPAVLSPTGLLLPDDSFADFSNWGTAVTVIAPGVQILSTFPIAGAQLGQSYGTISGTSMACPHVAGLAARLLATSPSKIRNIMPPAPGFNLTPAQVRGLILQRATENIGGIFDTRTYPLISAVSD